MPTETWFRNPDSYIRELVEVGEYKVAWDRGLLVKKRIDPVAHASLYFGKAFPYRILMVGEQGTAELRPGSTIERPAAVYPTWCYGEDAALLEEIIEQPVGMDINACSDFSVPPDERPVLGQEHRVVITDLPPSNTGPGRKFLRYLKTLQEDNPDCIIHVHGLYGFKVAFGMGWRAADVEPRIAAQKGKVHLPSGKEEKFERVQANPKWITILGFKPVDLEIPRNRCMYNIKSAVWAGEHYEKLYKFQTQRNDEPIDIESSPADYVAPETKSHLTTSTKAKEGDNFLCDTCSLQDKCKYYRNGAVCSVPGAEPIKLSRMFASRDADQIIDGLGTLVATNTKRLERGLQYEEVDGELDSEVSKMMGQVFDQGVKLAKLVDPGRFSGPKVQVNVGSGGAASIQSSNPRQLIAAAVRELEARGIKREDITTKMMEGLLTGMNNPESAQAAIEGTVMSSHEQSV